MDSELLGAFFRMSHRGVLFRNASPIEALMERKLGETYIKLISTQSRDKYKILMKRLKEVLSAEIRIILKQNSMFSPPFDPFSIKKMGRAEIDVTFVSRDEIKADGALEIHSQGFIVKLDRSLKTRSKEHRLRSTMAHELMHTFFYDTTRLPPAKIGRTPQSRKHFLMEEELCYYLAREFLVPTSAIAKLMTERKDLSTASVKNVRFLKDFFLVSSDIIAYRIVSDLSVWNAMFIKFMETKSQFKSLTKLKNKSTRLYRKIKIPSYLPSASANIWLSVLFDHISNTVNHGQFEELINLHGQMLALESTVESHDPLTVMTLVYKVD